MLDSLSYWDGSASAVGRAWLDQVLQRHDIARVLEPLLLLLLHPKTHRVSIQRVQAQRHWAQNFPQAGPSEPDPDLSEPIFMRDSGFSDRKTTMLQSFCSTITELKGKVVYVCRYIPTDIYFYFDTFTSLH